MRKHSLSLRNSVLMFYISILFYFLPIRNVVYYAKPNKKVTSGTLAISNNGYDHTPGDVIPGSRDSFASPNGLTPNNYYELEGQDGVGLSNNHPTTLSNEVCTENDYELEGPNDAYVAVDAIVASEDYNTLHETRRDENLDLNYSHIGPAERTEDMYDTTEPTPHGRTDGDMYSRIRRDRIEEGTYDHMDGRTDDHLQDDPDYCHISDAM